MGCDVSSLQSQDVCICTARVSHKEIYTQKRLGTENMCFYIVDTS